MEVVVRKFRVYENDLKSVRTLVPCLGIGSHMEFWIYYINCSSH